MSLHKIIDITEADFGCEEHLDGPHAVLVFEDGNRREVSKKWISDNKIEEGKSVWIKADKTIIKAINVVAAVIRHGDKIFATQRGYGDFKDGWEFPGGKIEPGRRSQRGPCQRDKGRTGYGDKGRGPYKNCRN